MPFQMSAHSKSFKLYLEEERKINNENKQAFGNRLPPPPPFFVKWNPSPNRVNGKNTRANKWGVGGGNCEHNWVFLVYTDPNKM